MQVVARKRKSLTRKAGVANVVGESMECIPSLVQVTDVLPLSTGQPEVAVAVFLFSEVGARTIPFRFYTIPPPHSPMPFDTTKIRLVCTSCGADRSYCSRNPAH